MHLLSINDLKKENIEEIFRRVPAMEAGFSVVANCNKIMATLFFEPSTRTKLSFHSAMYKLGGKVIDLPTNSSQNKGETDIDTVKTIAEYADILVIRHPKIVMKELAAASKKPVISAGEGSLHHPTQALLDLYTIRKYCKDRRSITIMFTGDIHHSRTISALVLLLKQESYHVNMLFTDTDESVIPHLLKSVDVLYMTRPQKERWLNGGVLPKGEPSKFILTKELAKTMRQDSLIMHPLPRNEEIHPEVDELHNARYFEQVRNGLYVRMALLNYLLWK